LIGSTDIEDSLQRLDKLTQEEARMALAELLKVAHSTDDRMTGVEGKVQDVHGDVQDVGIKVEGVDDRVQDVGNKVQGVDDRVQDVGNDIKDEVQGVDSRVQGVGNDVKDISNDVRGLDVKLDQVNRS
jgi:archaellum component FlaC